MLYEYISNVNRMNIQNIYGISWHKFKPNEMVMIEDMYWNGGNKLVGRSTRFFNYMILYAQTFQLPYLKQGLIEVKEKSNKERLHGIQNRRNVQSEIGDSSKCS